MQFVSTFFHTLPGTRAGWTAPPRSSRLLVAESGAEPRAVSQRSGHLAGCAADFSASGGVATGTDVAERLRAKVDQPVSALARWIVDRQVVAISGGPTLLLPLFQFDFATGCVRSGVAPTLSELAEVMNDNEVACWFAQPNAWLHGAAPAQILLSDIGAVLAAARADRFVANG